ncbi:hypothetical protein LTR53_003304 [Teratosphaeriaceae sp. CCFEE 6253]|nr:hypothetical protein LTR53_003304 [Teratosphaeriaceae sp. CCFEE 6253]
MARSPSDATRFTATGPYAASSPSFASSAPRPGGATPFGTQIDFGTAPANETPQQKIQRLRAAASLAKRGTESTFDVAVRVGRVWADRTHRVTAGALIGLTVITGCVATAGITDMLLHNRRRRNEWLAEQQMKTARDTAEAKRAMGRGAATEDQVLLVNRQRAAEESAEARRNRPGVWKRATGWLFSDLSAEEQKGGKLGAAAAATATGISEGLAPTQQPEGQKHDRSVLQAVKEKVDSTRDQGERLGERTLRRGGPLDQEAQLAVDTASNTTRSWLDSVTGR